MNGYSLQYMTRLSFDMSNSLEETIDSVDKIPCSSADQDTIEKVTRACDALFDFFSNPFRTSSVPEIDRMKEYLGESYLKQMTSLIQ